MINSDEKLLAHSLEVQKSRSRLGLSELTGSLEFIIINTEVLTFLSAAKEILSTTGFAVADAFEDDCCQSIVFKLRGSADLVLRSRKPSSKNPFCDLNQYPRAKALPNTRLECLAFSCNDVNRYVEIQAASGVQFILPSKIETDHLSFVQTAPSKFTGNSIGVVQWRSSARNYRTKSARDLNVQLTKPSSPYLENIFEIDHVATRLHAADRDDAILEFMQLTNFSFEFSIYVESLNSITNVARIEKGGFAHVFTSGISEADNFGNIGPTEKFVCDFGPRVHHVALHTENIEDTYEALKNDGMRYLIELVGSREEGLKQTFTVPSKNTLLVTEYIHRYDGFDGFFTRRNVTKLTAATA